MIDTMNLLYYLFCCFFICKFSVFLRVFLLCISGDPNLIQLPPLITELTPDQEEMLEEAKKYCMEQSVAHVLRKQTTSQQQNMMALQEAAQRQRALMLMCRIYVGSIYYELKDENIKAVFTPFGPIRSIDMSFDPQTQRHKGYAFIEYETPEAAQIALEQMNGVVVGGRNIKVGRPNNVPQAAPVIAQLHQEAENWHRVYVGSIHPDLSEVDVKSVFEAFGRIKSCELCPEPSRPNRHRGYGYVEYDNRQSKLDAIASMNLFELGGQYLRVGKGLTPPLPFPGTPGAINPFVAVAPPSAPTTLPPAAAAAAAAVTAKIAQTELSEQLHGEPTHTVLRREPSPPIAAFSSPPAVVQPKVSPAEVAAKAAKAVANAKASADKVSASVKAGLPESASLQEEESMEIKGSNARLMLMQKLSSRQLESSVMVLKNMVTADEVDEELEAEVTDECGKYGSVRKVVIYQERQGDEEDAEVIVKIFVAFSSMSGAEAGVKALDSRWFGGKMVRAELYDEVKFKANQLSD
ncbi:poly(U)-binding-splicing factor PUF60-like isoform X2 [Corticium candelabrum]|uniref:poly(U)-binding-splicing factor PUF60-like isoform X2 n=1 Tax=Corticium candelabrum TaxID=121492 RepID=UPI002E25C779|nr:poly(U)-binding-splicing factor PUF60-like isoform X2 [Corticium candelabrum]XP_062509428.1 poly(U)-binding-splicing factor PUF60-like isoform X2 [Corticium candelabrum]